ncbi:hypothetical protein TNCV_3329591 [Trichonephila clavipes]|nr:hypothetical protein TNCV_3329591 [Trichonephila clavipes]
MKRDEAFELHPKRRLLAKFPGHVLQISVVHVVARAACLTYNPYHDEFRGPQWCIVMRGDYFEGTVRTATASSNVVQSGRPIFDDFFQHLWPYIGNNTANVVFQMVKRL